MASKDSSKTDSVSSTEAFKTDTPNLASTTTNAPMTTDPEPATPVNKHLKSRIDSNESLSRPNYEDLDLPMERISFSSGRVFRPDPTQEEIETKTPDELRAQYPPDDARAMSPRRSSAETDAMEAGARLAIQKHAQSLQSSLSAIADQIETAKKDAGRLERDNLELQNYIGGVTRTMSGVSMVGKKK